MNEVETSLVEANQVEAKSEGNSSRVPTPEAAEPVVKSAPQSLPRSLPQTWNLSLRFFRDEAEMQAINSALSQTGWNRKRAAQLLRISYRGLLYKIRRHNIAPPAA
jgi:two-component system, NtrC family, response regulator AtoC